MKNATTIFYMNSAGMMCQWKGQVIATDETSISIRFSKNKAFKYNLKANDIKFLLVTNTPVKNIGVCISECSEMVSFDDSLIARVIEKTAGNVAMKWENKQWTA